MQGFEVLLHEAGQLHLSSFFLTAQLHPDAVLSQGAVVCAISCAVGDQATHRSSPRSSAGTRGSAGWAAARLRLPGSHPEEFQTN